MERLIKQLWSLRHKCKRYGDNLDTIIRRPSDSDFRRACFAMIFNSTTLTLELLSYYYEKWKGPFVETREEIRRKKEENAQRCIAITKMQFISSISSIEYCVKETINLNPKHSLAKWSRKQKRIYLSSIMKKSKRIGLINNKQHGFWECILKVRNVIVHNNGIADFDKTYQIDGITVSFVKGKMLKGKLDFFVKLTDKAVDLFHSWIMKFV